MYIPQIEKARNIKYIKLERQSTLELAGIQLPLAQRGEIVIVLEALE